jgi:radical SAM protein with 4Fe4S-binding SPASM domain
MKRPIGYMELEVFKKIIDEISKYPLVFLRIVGLGESSMNPNFSQMLQYASNKGIKIEIATNGELFERFMNKKILSWDIDILGVSVDGIDKDSYEKIRIGGRYDNLVQKIEKLYEDRNKAQRKYPLIVIRKVIMPTDKREEIQRYITAWQDISEMITFNTLFKVDNRMNFEYKSSYKCNEFYYISHIRYDGSVILCPRKYIFDQNDVIGNIKFNELRKIWQSDELKRIRVLHKKKLYPEYCKSCFMALDREKFYDNSRKYNFSNNRIQNKLNKYLKVT